MHAGVEPAEQEEPGLAVLGRRNTPDIAGLNVSELIAEKTNEKTIVMANWL